MAKNKGLKWIVGLSSVAVFTGFVGLSQKYDQSGVATTTSSQSNENNGSYFPNDNSGSWSDSDNSSQFGSSSDQGGYQGGYSRHGGFRGNSGSENSDSNEIRGHAS